MLDPDVKAIETHEPLLLESTEHQLREQVEALKKQLQEASEKKNKGDEAPQKPRGRTLWLIGLALVVVFLLALFFGWLPRHRRENELKKEAKEETEELPQVDFVRAQRSATTHELMLPGNIEAETDAPVLARADGYIKKRYVDIGDRVKKGQLMAEIEAPELDQQVLQGQAQLAQAKASQRQANAALDQGKANEELARVTAVRWQHLVEQDAVSRQENDTYQANYKAQAANVIALGQAVEAAKENVGAAEANLQRLVALQSYKDVRAPFDGVVTVRNIDSGALVGSGNTLLFRVAAIDILRTYIYVPQAEVSTVQVGQPAQLFSVELGGAMFPGTIRRTANSLDPTTRTLLTEVQVPNPHRVLLPGMFVQVNLKNRVANPPILIPGDALLVRSNGTLAAVLTDYHRVDPAQLKQEEQHKEELQKKAGTKDKDKDKKDSKESKDGKDKGQDSSDQGASAGQQNKSQQEVLEGKVHMVQVSVGRDYGNAVEIYQGLEGDQIVIANPNDSVREGSRVRATATKAKLDQLIASPNGTKNNVNSEKLQTKPGAEPIPPQPSRLDKTRGSGH